MADAIVSSIVNEVVGRLTSLASQEVGLLWGFKTDLSALQSTFTRIQCVLHDAEEKQGKDKALQDWLRKLRAVSFEMEDILDEVSTEAMIRRLDTERGIKQQVTAFFSIRNPVLFRFRMAHKVKNIRERLDAVATEKSKFGLKEGVGDIGVGDDMGNRVTSSLVNDIEIVGRDEEKEMIVEKICNSDWGDEGDGVSLYAIWGMGGIGKTTLSQLVYKDPRVKKHFELKKWVCVSDNFDVLGLTKAIIESIEGNPCHLSQLDPLQQQLRETLRGKRFLLVLDDVWNDDRRKWEVLRQALVSGAKGSMIMVTTRDKRIAGMMATRQEFVHQVGCLSEDDSWSLFKRLAFGVGRTEKNIIGLEPIGKAIVKKCKGLPLAVKAMGSLMWSKSSVSEWKLVMESETWHLEDEGSSILPALKLSYDNLPPHFRQCFAYCCLFPKDHVMRKDLLIELWMANGFIPSRGETDSYELGEEIFKGLVWRSFFQDVRENSEDKLYYKMHDLMHDLAQSVMWYEFSFFEPGRVLKFPDDVLHMSSKRVVPSEQDLLKLRSLRSLLILDANVGTFPLYIFRQRYLRVLQLHRIRGYRLPESLYKLKHVRYLDMTRSHMKELPESIVYLQNLQVLKLNRCLNLCKLPKGLRYMRNLQFLDFELCYKLQHMPAGMGQLTRLRRLTKFIVGRKAGEQIGELGELNRLGWQLEIEGLEKVTGLEASKSAKLNCKGSLYCLNLFWPFEDQKEENRSGGGNLSLEDKDEEVFEGLEPHSNLKKLGIWNYNGTRLPNWMANLVNLVEIEIRSCRRIECFPPRGSSGDTVLLPSLQMLGISDCPRLIELDANLLRLEQFGVKACDERLLSYIGKFSTLTRLHIDSFKDLKALPDEIFANSTALKALFICNCDSLESLPQVQINLRSLEELKIYGCEQLKFIPAEWFQGMPNLMSLCIDQCQSLESLSDGMGSLLALSSLEIRACPSLIRLPDGLQCLNTLRSLVIALCPNLEERCEKEIGEDWPKIFHVPYISIDFQVIQSL